MIFTIRTIDVTASGREITRERQVEGDRLSIGRASENALALPDLAVEQRHLLLLPQPNGALALEAAGRLGFTLDGRPVQGGRIDAGRSGEIALGSYRLEVAVAPGAVAITVRAVAQDHASIKDRVRGFGLDAAMPGRRVAGWALLLAILGAFLAVPVWSHLTRERVEPDAQVPGQVAMDASWRSGPLSSAHHTLEDNCEACHAEPFVAVRDDTCLTCHGDIADHAQAPRMAQGRAPMQGGEALLWQIGAVFNKPGVEACTTCHTEHEGEGRMQPAAQQFCADCHGTLDTRLADTRLGNAHDFGELHPQFQARVVPVRGARAVRLPLDRAAGDFNGLKFAHDLHLSASNGVARMATRLDGERRGGLICADCHTPRDDGVRFQPVDMEQSCEGCHSLVYDRVGSSFRSLSHGDVDAAAADLAALDRSARRPLVPARRRPGQFGEGGLYYSNFAPSAAPRSLSRAALAEGGLCGECHYPAGGAALDVLPVRQSSRYFTHGWFDHGPHDQEDCATCHAADQSGRASDLLIPGIAVCRDCHLGEQASEAEVPSGCAMCHSYHPPARTNAAPRRVASVRARERGP